MPSAAEVLKQLVEGQKQILNKLDEIDGRVTALEQRPAGDAWLEEEIVLDEPFQESPGSTERGTPRNLEQPDPATVDEDAGMVTILPPNRKQRKFREAWLPRIALENLPKEWGLSKDEADEAYRAGGPVWLYLAGAGFNEEEKSGRHYILSLAPEVRACMVHDLEMGEVSPQWIHEFARDILKDEGVSRRAAEVFAEATAEGYRMPGVG